MATQTQFSTIQALVIDDMSVQQTTLRGQLGQLGITRVDVAANAEDAARQIRSRRYNLILCDYNLNQKTDGQQLFEHLRDTKLLPADCLFFMVTAESAYASVAAATEHHPDAYLLKPITASHIEDRLKTLLEKRDALLPITQKLAKDDLLGAVQACDQSLKTENRWTMAVLQIKGKTLLQLGKHEDAKQTYRQALDKRANLPWAQLGLARAHKAAGQFDEARQLAQDIIQTPEGEKNVAAYDVVAESMDAKGDAQGAMWVLRDAATVVPSARRQRLLGESAYRNGDLDTAKECMQKVAKATRGSVIAQPQDTLLLAQAMVDLGESAEALKLLAEGSSLYRNLPAFGSVALAIQVQAQVKAGTPDEAEKTLKRARETLRQGKADFATIALAKAELMAGHEEEGLKLLATAVSSDHENPKTKQMIGNALRETGHEDKIDRIINTASAAMQARVQDARKLLRDSQIDEAVAAIETAVRDYPENTGVLLQATQINCMALRLKKEHNNEMVERVRLYLNRLEQLMPGNDRVTMMKRYFRETLASMETASAHH
ncbi:tetratricopeptide repeat-containing response regulator [Aquabacterium sp.]|uniref:tetratricopeptide repeat-containing response regulator n=1 Tax=Aquabacterium sp. TaxID=1872578 RepID=UPI002488D9C5|nr:tetratricopeptide repeat-containing response regulator [Aquabacterium sp.]MDI1259044.1 tetratricopeptide repeat protein [Aquabacterium sp.]